MLIFAYIIILNDLHQTWALFMRHIIAIPVNICYNIL